MRDLFLFTTILCSSFVTTATDWRDKTPNISTWHMQKITSATPRPTIIVGHGCDGLTSALIGWGREFGSWGYNLVYYDSLTSKGYGHGTCKPGDEFAVSPEYRAREAQELAKWIKQQPWHTGKVAYIGESSGGSTALRVGMIEKEINEISVAISFYPWCGIWDAGYKGPLGTPKLNKDTGKYGWATSIPTQMHLGGSDDWTSPTVCYDVSGAEHFTYNNATHAFDFDYPNRSMFGHKLKYDRNAHKLSRERIRKFLQEKLS
jgi:dienelactone hydrolase